MTSKRRATKFLCVFFAFVLLVTAVPMAALADYIEEQQTYDAELTGTAEVVPLQAFPERRRAWVWAINMPDGSPADPLHTDLVINSRPQTGFPTGGVIPAHSMIWVYGSSPNQGVRPVNMYWVNWPDHLGNVHNGYVWGPFIQFSPPIPVYSIQLTNPPNTLLVGNTHNLGVAYTPSNSSWQEVHWWSDNPDIIDVNQSGTIVARAAGTTTIRARSYCGHRESAVTLTSTISVTGVNITNHPPNNTMEVGGGTHQLGHSITPGNASNQAVTWTSLTPSVATVNQSGVLTAVSRGTAVIRVTTVDGNHQAQFTLTVRQPVTGITVSPTNFTLNINGAIHGTRQLSHAIIPPNANNTGVTWSSSDTTVATVSNTGLVRAVSPGTAQIFVRSAENGAIAAVSNVTVNMLATDIEVCRDEITLYILDPMHGSDQIVATVSPDNTTNPTVRWESSDEDIVTVDENGVITAIYPGTATITAWTTDGTRLYAETLVTVEMLASGLLLCRRAVTLIIEEPDFGTDRLEAVFAPQNISDPTVRWSSSDENIVTVDEYGNITAVGPGVAYITATVDNFSFTSRITVISLVTEIRLCRALLSLNIRGDYRPSVALTAEILPGNATDLRLRWSSSNPLVASVDSNGRVTAGAPGLATITATSWDGRVVALVAVTVSSLVTEVSVSPSAYTLSVFAPGVGETRLFSAFIAPPHACIRTVRWVSSNPAVARVDSNGVVTGVAPGTAVITAISDCDGGNGYGSFPPGVGHFSASATVTVIQQPTSVSLPRTWINLNHGQTHQLVATVLPENAWHRGVTWSSNAPGVVSVDGNGVVTVHGQPGQSAAITATTVNGLMAVTAVQINIPVQSVTVLPRSRALTIGQTYRFAASVLPHNATNQTVRWSSSNPAVATVDGSGYVRTQGIGTARIYAVADCGGHTSYSTLTVRPRPLFASISAPATAAVALQGGVHRVRIQGSVENAVRLDVLINGAIVHTETRGEHGNWAVTHYHDLRIAGAHNVQIRARNSEGVVFISHTRTVTVRNPVAAVSGDGSISPPQTQQPSGDVFQVIPIRREQFSHQLFYMANFTYAEWIPSRNNFDLNDFPSHNPRNTPHQPDWILESAAGIRNNEWDWFTHRTGAMDFYMDIYRRPAGSNRYDYVFAFRGTAGALGWVNNVVQIGLNGPGQADVAVRHVNEILNANRSNVNRVYFTGHSLGGYLTQWIQSLVVDGVIQGGNGGRAISFSSPGFLTIASLSPVHSVRVNTKLTRNLFGVYNTSISNYVIVTENWGWQVDPVVMIGIHIGRRMNNRSVNTWRNPFNYHFPHEFMSIIQSGRTLP